MNLEAMKAKIINRQMLTDNVIELTIETYQEMKIIPGQWVLFMFTDDQGDFQRAYSIVDQDTDNEKTMLIFAIKLLENGRGSVAIKNLHIGHELTIKWPFGHFILHDTASPKVFIWTWIGITPVLNMAKYCTTDKQLFFSISYKKDLFYEERIKKIHGLWYEISLSRESLPGYHSGRINLANHQFTPDTEFYLCGKPEVIDDMVSKLTSKWHTKIYTEKY